MTHPSLSIEYAVCSNDIGQARQLAADLGGTLYCDEREKHGHLPFRALVTCVTDDPTRLEAASDVGLYLVCRRLVKPGVPAVVGLFPMVRRPDLSHEQADAHWREVHAPLTFEHHVAMSHYSQLSVLQCLKGPQYDGFALCGFRSVSDLREKFYTLPESPAVIANDVLNFADPKGSPPRLIATVTALGSS